jgi:two-component system, sensor histidine kinase and response regulator
MKLNQLNRISNLTPGKTTNESPAFQGPSPVPNENNQEMENHLLQQVRDLEEINVHLIEVIDKQAKELAGTSAKNAKFISIIAHDLRSPFSIIISILDALKGSLSDYNQSEIEKFIDIASNSANRTLKLMDNLLAWTILQNKEKVFAPVKLNLKELLTEEIETIHMLAKQKQITLNHLIPSNLYVSADLQMVKTILRNLIGNAIKYTNTGG